MPQRWACALEPDWHLRRNELTGRSQYVRRIVYCNTEQFRYETAHDPKWCLLHDRRPSWAVCRFCPDNEGIGSMGSDLLPGVIAGACRTKDLRFDVHRKACRECTEKLACLSKLIRDLGNVRFRLVRRK